MVITYKLNWNSRISSPHFRHFLSSDGVNTWCPTYDGDCVQNPSKGWNVGRPGIGPSMWMGSVVWAGPTSMGLELWTNKSPSSHHTTQDTKSPPPTPTHTNTRLWPKIARDTELGLWFRSCKIGKKASILALKEAFRDFVLVVSLKVSSWSFLFPRLIPTWW